MKADKSLSEDEIVLAAPIPSWFVEVVRFLDTSKSSNSQPGALSVLEVPWRDIYSRIVFERICLIRPTI